MKITHHVSTGARHDGNEFDCPICRARLLEAFRAPATAPEPVTLPHMVPGERLPHLIVGDEHSRTVDMGSIPNEEIVDLNDISRPGHDTMATAHSFRHLPGGSWHARCMCGWIDSGIWTPEQGEIWGLGAAQEACDAHRAEQRREEER